MNTRYTTKHPTVLLLGIALVTLFQMTTWAKQQIPPRDRPVLVRPAIAIAATASPPTIDGVLDDACWESAVTVRPFPLCYQARYAPFDTEARLTYDADNLYVAFRCFDHDPAVHTPPPLPAPNAKGTAEVLIDAGIPEKFYKIAIGNDGVVLAGQWGGGAMTWAETPAAAKAGENGAWTAEFAIPFSALSVPPPTPTGTWRMNLGRRRPNRIGNVAWATTYAWFYEPQFFGDVYFAGEQACTAEIAHVESPGPGTNALSLVLANRAGAPMTMQATVTIEERTGTLVLADESINIPAGERVAAPLDYTLSDGTVGVVTVRVAGADAAYPLLLQSIPANVAANRKTIQEAALTLHRIKLAAKEHRATLPPGYKTARKALAAEIDDMQDTLARDDCTLQEWQALEKPLERLLSRANKLLWWIENDCGQAPFAVGSAGPMTKMFRDRAYTGPVAKALTLSGARGEYEGAQLVLIPFGQPLEDITVAATALTGPRGEHIPAEHVEVKWVDFIETRPPRHPMDYTGWTADPLIPMDAADRAVPAGAFHQPLWVTVHIPKDIAPGQYQGAIEVQADKLPALTLPLRVRVYDFDLPLRPSLQTVFWLNQGYITKWYGWDAIPPEIRREHMAFLLRYRISPGIGPKIMEPLEDFQFALDRGLNTIQLGNATSWPMPDATLAQIDEHYAYLRDRDLLDMAFVYAIDEPDPSEYPEVRHILTEFAKRYPGLKRVCTAFPPAEGLEGAVDTWIVTGNLYNEDAVKARQAASDELWFYGGPTLKRPYANWYVDYTGIEERIIFWHCWKYGAKGLLHWCINRWYTNTEPWSGVAEIDDAIRAGKRWPEVPWNAWTYLNVNGEAQLLYPGTDGRFWSSVRLEIFRDGMEDYDYLALLQELRDRLAETEVYNRDALLSEADTLLAVGPPVVCDLTAFADDPAVLLRYREAVAKCIERVSRALGQ